MLELCLYRRIRTKYPGEEVDLLLHCIEFPCSYSKDLHYYFLHTHGIDELFPPASMISFSEIELCRAKTKDYWSVCPGKLLVYVLQINRMFRSVTLPISMDSVLHTRNCS